MIRTGHGDFVVIAEANEHFRSARVQLGVESSELVAVQSGLKQGDQVAVNGQFLLDGAASMRTLQARLDNNTPAKQMDAAPMPMTMHDHSMMGMKP